MAHIKQNYNLADLKHIELCSLIIVNLKHIKEMTFQNNNDNVKKINDSIFQ